jgi:tRNA nucleotidyltransferase (CCA-adding enzyme)
MDRTHLATDLFTHPVVARLRPHLTGDVSAVGGVVRDALLGRDHHHDLDLVVEGDAIGLAREVAHVLGVPVSAHERFGTAVLELPHDDGHVDFISARREHYPAPGALPIVSQGTLADDLARRDFSINAMALRLTGVGAGELVDPFGGVADLDAGLVRSLRADAFVEDPSRIVRAARYAGRLGFAVEPTTSAAIVAAVGGLAWTSARVADELRRLLDEASPGPGLAVLHAIGAPGVAPDAEEMIRRLDAAHTELAARDPHGPALAGWALRAGVALEDSARTGLAVPGWARGLADEVADGPRLRDTLERIARPSEIDHVLAHAPVATQIAAHALGAPHIVAWWTSWRGVHVALRGGDLIAAGIAPGPAIGRALAALRAAVLDGELADVDAQRAFAIRAARADHP